MPLRGDVSLIQPGYRMEVGGESIEIIPFGNAPADGGTAPRFPTEPLSRRIRADNWTVYDVYQAHVFSEADEDRFEGADPVAALGMLGRARLVSEYSPPSALVELIRHRTSERLFLNERTGYVALRVDIAFETDLDNPDYPFVGHATVTITNLEPERFRDGHILPITVYETRIDADGERGEWIADRMTIHLVPGFFTVESAYFTDRREGLEAIDEIFGGINEKYTRYERDLLPAGPEWQMRRRLLTEEAKVASLQRFIREEGPAAEQLLGRFRVPQLER
jgi:hypothetical protein